jgi:hypothetical protein
MEEDPESDLELDMEGVIGKNTLFTNTLAHLHSCLRLVSSYSLYLQILVGRLHCTG